MSHRIQVVNDSDVLGSIQEGGSPRRKLQLYLMKVLGVHWMLEGGEKSHGPPSLSAEGTCLQFPSTHHEFSPGLDQTRAAMFGNLFHPSKKDLIVAGRNFVTVDLKKPNRMKRDYFVQSCLKNYYRGFMEKLLSNFRTLQEIRQLYIEHCS